MILHLVMVNILVTLYDVMYLILKKADILIHGKSSRGNIHYRVAMNLILKQTCILNY